MTAKQKLRRCDRCRKRLRNLNAADDWNVIFEYGVITELICPDCQSPLENAEAAINEATLDYKMVGGRLAGFPKAGGLQ